MPAGVYLSKGFFFQLLITDTMHYFKWGIFADHLINLNVTCRKYVPEVVRSSNYLTQYKKKLFSQMIQVNNKYSKHKHNSIKRAFSYFDCTLSNF